MKKNRLLLLSILVLFLCILNGYFFNYLNDLFFNFENNDENGLKKLSNTLKYVIVVLISPIVETFFFQMLPNLILSTFFKNKKILVLIPSLIFSIVHVYNPIYMIMAFFGGVFLNFYYIESKNHTKYFFILTVLIHSLYNCYGIIFVK